MLVVHDMTLPSSCNDRRPHAANDDIVPGNHDDIVQGRGPYDDIIEGEYDPVGLIRPHGQSHALHPSLLHAVVHEVLRAGAARSRSVHRAASCKGKRERGGRDRDTQDREAGRWGRAGKQCKGVGEG